MRDQSARKSLVFHESFRPFAEGNIENSIATCFEIQVQRFPHRPAVTFKDESVNYLELNRAANRLVNAYSHLKRPNGETIALLIDQGIPLIGSILAVLKLGLGYVPLDRRNPITAINSVLLEIQPAAVFTDASNVHFVRQLSTKSIPVLNVDTLDDALSTDNPDIEVKPDTVASIYYTSGSTGEPKGVVDVHRNILHNVMRYTNSLGFCSADRMSLVQHSSFSGTVSTIFGALLNGACLIPYDLDRDGLSDIANWALEEEITVFHSVPTIFRHLARGNEHYPHLRLIRLEGDLTSIRDIELFQRTFSENCVLVNGLGATECGLVRQFFIDKKTRLTGQNVPLGYAVQDVDVRVINESGSKVKDQNIGEIVVESPYVARGYWRNPNLTATKFGLEASGMRTYRTGDLGYQSIDGCLYLSGRKDFQVKIRGNNVNTVAVEAAILSVRHIERVLVRSVKDSFGELNLIAYVVPRDSSVVTVTDILEALHKLLPNYAVPSKFAFVDQLPVTVDGKIDRSPQTDIPSGRPPVGSRYVLPETELESSLVSIWAEVLGLEADDIGVLDSFFDLGGDSLRANQVLVRLAERLDVKIAVVAIFEHRTVRDLASFVVGRPSQISGQPDHMSRRVEKQIASMAKFRSRR